ncbi:hypothetical protein [Viridibacillus soli]|nr:hypothetical protein [Viridibacillus soli]
MKKLSFKIMGLLSFALFLGAMMSTYAQGETARLHFITLLNSF